MTDQAQPKADSDYVHGYTEEHRAFLAVRTAENEGAFLLPHLRPGMRLLDCGCGMGALTTSLAEWIAPGEVVGFDREASQIEAARQWAAAKGVTNVTFTQGDIYAIPFPDASFDAALAYTVLEHVDDPLRALREMRRVLKPGGVVGIVDPDYGTQVVAPDLPLVQETMRLIHRFSEEHASPYYARHLREYLLEAGFARSIALPLAIGRGDDRFARFGLEGIIKPTLAAIRPWAKAQGLADDARMDALLAAMEAWSDRPDTFLMLTLVQAVGWAPE